MQIKGPDGRVADVDLENRLNTFAVSQNEDKHLNIEGRYWSIFFAVTPTAGDDYFFYLKNTGTKDLFLTDIRISSSVVTKIFYDHVTGEASTGTDSTITNRNLGSPKEPAATIQHSVDFTGLTKLGELSFEECATVDTLCHLRLTGTIIIPQGQAVAFRRVEATGLITCIVSLAESE